MSTQLMRAILALDAYNRGYNAGVKVSGTKLGDATLTEPRANQNIGFFAQSYNLNGEKIISYRGTDTPLPTGEGSTWEKILTLLSPYLDGVNGFGIGRGSPYGAEALTGIDFYKTIAAKTNEELTETNVTLVGQSLGGGIAGLVAALYGQESTIFAHMPFLTAAQNAHYYSIIAPGIILADPTLKERIYDTATPWLVDTSNISAYAVLNESMGILTASNPFGNRVPIPIDLDPFDPDGVLGGTQRHAQNVHVLSLFADEKLSVADKAVLPKFMSYEWRALMDAEIGKAIGLRQGADTDSNATGIWGEEHQLQAIINYSAVEGDGKPYGNTGIYALFNDSIQLAKLYDQDLSGILLKGPAVKDALAEIVAQFAGDLAKQKSEDPEHRKGAIGFGEDNSLLLGNV